MNLTVAFAAAGTLVLWASAFPMIRLALREGYGPGELTLARFVIATVTLVIILCLRTSSRGGIRGALLPASEWKYLVPLGFIGVALYHLALNYGARTTDAGTVAMLIATSPVFTAGLAVLLLGERLKATGWIGIAVSCSGAVLIAVGKDGRLGLSPGAALVLLAAMLAAMWAVMQRPIVRRIGPMRTTTYATCIGTVFLLPFLPSLIRTVQSASVSTNIGVLYLGILPAAIANVLWAYALGKVPASRLAVFMYLMPPISIFIAWLFLNEVPTTLAMIGGAIAIAGVVIVNTSKGSSAARIAQQAVPSPAANAGD